MPIELKNLLMGSQQAIPYKDNQPYLPTPNTIPKDALSEPDGMKTVMLNKSIASVSSPKRCINVADFAKVKIEPPPYEESSESEQDILSKQNVANDPDGMDISAIDIQEDCTELGIVCQPSIEIKQEILAEHMNDTAAFMQKEVFSPFYGESNAESSLEEHQSTIISQVADESGIVETFESYSAINKDRNILKKKLSEPKSDVDDFDSVATPNSTKLVKNPLAFLKKKRDKKRKEMSLNNTVKLESILNDEDIEASWKSAVSSKDKSPSEIKLETDLETNNLNAVIIKSESINFSETNEELTKNASLYQTCLSCDLDTSFDVNFIYESTDLNEEASSKNCSENITSNISLNETKPSLQYNASFEMSSVEESAISSSKTKYKQNIENRKTRTTCKKINYKEIGKRRKLQTEMYKNRQKRVAKKRTKKYLSKKCRDNGSNIMLGAKSKQHLKKLPKTAVKTIKKTSNKSTTKKVTDCISKEAEFPIPFKIEPQEFASENITETVEFPKPMMFKRTMPIMSKKCQTYLKPDLQPFVRLKRLKSEELLVPMTTKRARKTRKFKGSNETRNDFHIKQVYSLNCQNKQHRFSMDFDNISYYEQPSFSSRESLGDMATNYFSSQERLTLFQASSVDVSSMFSGPIDSGVSTSTPITNYSHQTFNNTLLLKIAAERAFINNHLKHFGYSPIQFNLYNNINELNVFLKFLLGNGYIN